MGSLTRSEDMVLLRLYFPKTAAHATMDELGKLGVFQIEDLNTETSMFQRAFSDEVKLCDEMLRKLRFLCKEIELDPALKRVLSNEMEPAYSAQAAHTGPLESKDLIALDQKLSQHEQTVREIQTNKQVLTFQQASMKELKAVLEVASGIISNAPVLETVSAYGALRTESSGTDEGGLYASEAPQRQVTERLLRPGSIQGQIGPGPAPVLLDYYTGVIETAKVPAFQRILFRSTRGNFHGRFVEIEEPLTDPETGIAKQKSVFVIFLTGAQIKDKVSRICSAFNATKYPVSNDPELQKQAYAECSSRIDDLQIVLDQTDRNTDDLLRFLARKMPAWTQAVLREKAVHHNLNMLNLDTSQKLLIAEGWCPAADVEKVNDALEIGRQRSRVDVSSVLEYRAMSGHVHPPTYFKLNKFTRVFQGIVESYGVASYKEMNPAIFATITFPFLFAVMFGDIGHGSIMALVAYMLVRMEPKMMGKKLDEMTEMIFDGRYIILLMGIFSIFTGAIYNEFFAIPLDIFGSRWKYTSLSTMACGIDNCAHPAAVLPPLKPYPFGFDPIWKSSQTALLFFNSYKMKLSIVLGVSQMVMGITCSYLNAAHMKEPLDIYYVFIPQMIFMNATFGYLVVLIFLKWSIDWNAPGAGPAPDLKGILIGMFMSPGNVPPELQLYPGQAIVQVVLLILALVAVPWMLLPKPLLLKRRHEQHSAKKYKLVSDNGFSEESALLGGKNGASGSAGSAKETSALAAAPEEHEEEFDFSEIFVGQMIHTIEFVLGAVSNTASYLRLWALSLAHAELSDVFLEKLLFMTIGTGSVVAIIIGFFLWLGSTIGVLMLMESLSAFLHTLRLHWVEFQNKFYNLHDSGSKFSPFTYETLEFST
ncbi:V-type proton ATPase subunit a2 [Porphyridium purpureum]|uniref:V-type proton ATPase subunit a n=1 Tax=Porphyridium purpureum TaxID=35688 RepID=A0A5J4YT39_PORPP|nr:V-type proton ATPase subunit a2 [Porphyridium purpureum]|eukprot:POR2018..scf227_4